METGNQEFNGIEKDRNGIAKKRRSEKLHDKRSQGIASFCGLFGPYFDQKKGRVVNKGRGKCSKYLKKVANKKVRKTNLGTDPSSYRKAYDYWWEII